MYTSYSTLQRKQLSKQVYTDTQSTYLLVYAPGRHKALQAALQNLLHRKFRLVTRLEDELTPDVAGVLLVSEDVECTPTALTYFAAALREGADLAVCDASFGFDGSTALYLSIPGDELSPAEFLRLQNIGYYWLYITFGYPPKHPFVLPTHISSWVLYKIHPLFLL